MRDPRTMMQAAVTPDHVEHGRRPHARASVALRNRVAIWLAVLALASLVAGPGIGHAQQRPIRGMEAPHPCGVIYTRHYGPYDYRTEREKLRIVEEFHFTPEMEAGIRGVNSTVAGEVNYTLKASPNHHRALVTLMRVVERARQDSLPGMEWPLECYFDRAIRFAHDDPVVRMLYAQFLSQRNRKPEAEKQLLLASQFAPENPLTQYNVGLVALEIGNHDLALKQAHLARAMGFARMELESALRSINRWRDPPSDSPAAAASAASTAPPVDLDARYTVTEPASGPRR